MYPAYQCDEENGTCEGPDETIVNLQPTSTHTHTHTQQHLQTDRQTGTADDLQKLDMNTVREQLHQLTA